jgi:hypothetical protein
MLKHLIIAAALLAPVAARADDAAKPHDEHAKPHGEHKEKGEGAIKKWAHSHAEAAKDLDAWMKANGDAAALIVEWEGQHPKAAKKFVHFHIEHKDKGLADFESGHAATAKHKEPEMWVHFDKLMNDHKAAADSFIEWVRKHPKAAEDLMKHRQGLKWAGHHMAQAEKDMEGGDAAAKPASDKQ